MYERNLVVKLSIIAAILIAQITITSANPGIIVNVTPVNPQVVPPGNATYSVAVVSISTVTEMVNLSIVNPKNGWAYSFSYNDFELLAGETKNVELNITVPSGTSNGNYFHDVRGFAVVPGFVGVFDEETFFLDVLTTALPPVPEMSTFILTSAGIVGIVVSVWSRRR